MPSPASGLLRRWLLPALGVLVTVAGIGYVIKFVPLTYQSQASVVLLPPAAPANAVQATGNVGLQNPLLSFSNALNVDARLLIQELNDPTVQRAVAARGGTASYSATGSVDQITPLVVLTSSSRDPAVAARTTRLLVEESGALLARRQAAVGAPSDAQITLQMVNPLTAATSTWHGRLKDLVGVVLAGGLLTLLLARLSGLWSRRALPLESGTGSEWSDRAVSPGPAPQGIEPMFPLLLRTAGRGVSAHSPVPANGISESGSEHRDPGPQC